ncbi:MAG: hypothetical protein JOZ80_05250 [Acidobacteriaceae bacterium]|nr:hypothetical protein [Acidobacteriaceae bacterium]
MRSPVQSVVLAIYVLCIYIALPIAILGGWVRWTKQPKSWTAFSVLSMIGFLLATFSALLAFASLLYAHAIGGFPFYNPRLVRFYHWGGRSSLAGIGPGMIGCFRRNTLRWYAPICAIGVFIFWFASAIAE